MTRTVLAGLLAASLLGSARAEFVLFKNIWGDVLVSTDTTEAGRGLKPASPQEPVYYLGMSLGNRLGSIPGDEEPEKKKMNRFIADVLAKQGYIGANQGGGHEPTLFLVVQWGYITPGSENLLWFLGYNVADDIGAPVMGGMLGPEVFRTGMRSHLVNTILDDAKGPIYGIIVTAFDYKTAKSANPVALWQSRIGLPANNKTMAEALPVMMLAAGPSIGKESDKALLSDADAVRSGTVRFGELEVLDSFGESPAAKETNRK